MANLGAAHIGGYSDFINSMLELQEQRLQEERYKQLERMENQKQMTDMIGNVGSSISQYAGQMGQNSMANQLMAEQYGAPPRAEAVNTPWSNELAAGKPGFYTGGMPELKMRMAMAEDRSQADYRSAMIGRMGQNLELQQDKWRVQQAVIAKKDIDKELDQATKNENWYIKETRVIDSAIAKATTPEQWQNAVDSKLAVNRAAIKRGLKVDPFDPTTIAPFMSEDDRTTLETQQGKVAKARKDLERTQKAPPGFVERMIPYTGLGAILGEGVEVPGLGKIPGLGYKIPSEKEAGVLTAQKLYEAEQQKLRETPGASFYGEKPVTPQKTEATSTSAPAKSGTLSETYPVNTIRRSKSTGRAQKWDGTKWVDF